MAGTHGPFVEGDRMGADTAVCSPAAATGGLDRLLGELAAGAGRWAETGLLDRTELLRRTHRSIGRAADRWARTAADLKGLDPASPLTGEEWLSGPYAVLTATERLARTL